MEEQEKGMTVEKEHLAETQRLIQQEMEKLFKELGLMKQEIVDYRKFLTEEIPQDEYHMMNVGSEVKETQYTATYQRIVELSRMYYAPYFGLISFLEEGESLEESYYIGKRGLTHGGDPLILDWRTPAASLFYQQHLGEMSFRAPGGEIRVDLKTRRQYIIKDGELKGMFDSELDIKDDILQMVLSGSSGDRLKEVIATIQKEQDDLIRAPLDENVLLDGVAGSGKTTVILHRVAYLLYNFREKLKDNILILGPNQIFMEYISQVLPDLGETEGTYQRTLRRLAAEVLELTEPVMGAGEYFERLMHGTDEAWRKSVYERADIGYMKVLDEELETFQKEQRLREDLTFQGRLLLSAQEANELFDKTYRSMPYNKRVKRIKRLVNSRLADMRNRYARKLQKEYEQKIKEAKAQGNGDLANRLRYEGNEKLYRFMCALYEYRIFLRQVLPVQRAESWYRQRLRSADTEPWTEEDLWAMLYLAARLNGKGLFSVRHLVVDEAQDVSALGLAALLWVTGTESITVVGDVRQKIKGRDYPSLLDEWEKAMPAAMRKQTKPYQLRTSYRSTREIMEYAMAGLEDTLRCPVQTVERPGEPVREERAAFCEAELLPLLREGLSRLREQNMERIAVLTENMEQAKLVAQWLGEEAELVTGEKKKNATDRVPVMPVYFAKGLEYDGVIAIDTMKDSLTHYVLCTRALHRLIHIQIQ